MLVVVVVVVRYNHY